MKKIAIVGSSSSSHFGIGKNYHEWVSQFGVPLIVSPTADKDTLKEIAEQVDLLVLPGGADLSSHFYGKRPSLFNTNPDLLKEYFFVNGLDVFIDAGTAIFGICLGFQMINVKFGGTLTQHINTDIHQKDTRWSNAHQVCPFNKSYGKDFNVNSHHHQAVRPKDMSPEMIPLFFSNEDSKVALNCPKDNLIIESFKHKELPIAGVQWHPEEWYDEHSTNLVLEMINKSSELKSKRVKSYVK